MSPCLGVFSRNLVATLLLFCAIARVTAIEPALAENFEPVIAEPSLYLDPASGDQYLVQPSFAVGGQGHVHRAIAIDANGYAHFRVLKVPLDQLAPSVSRFMDAPRDPEDPKAFRFPKKPQADPVDSELHGVAQFKTIAPRNLARGRPGPYHLVEQLGPVDLVEPATGKRIMAFAMPMVGPSLDQYSMVLDQVDSDVTVNQQTPFGRKPRAHERVPKPGKDAFSLLDEHGNPLRDPVEVKIRIRRTEKVLHDLLVAAAALWHAGILHRDIKPRNIALGWNAEPADPQDLPTLADLDADRAHVELLDFGYMTSVELARITPLRMGTPGFIAPEAYRGQLSKLGPASDLYSIGATVFWLITGGDDFHLTDANSQVHPNALNRELRAGLDKHALDPAKVEIHVERLQSAYRRLGIDVADLKALELEANFMKASLMLDPTARQEALAGPDSPVAYGTQGEVLGPRGLRGRVAQDPCPTRPTRLVQAIENLSRPR